MITWLRIAAAVLVLATAAAEIRQRGGAARTERRRPRAPRPR
jgi:hypothetical protein